jgi:hypothetical protein
MKSKAAHNYVPSRQRKPDEKRKQNKKMKKINTFQQPHHVLQTTHFVEKQNNQNLSKKKCIENCMLL